MNLINNMKTLLIIIGALSVLLTSCNTIAGIGRDMTALGNTMSKADAKSNGY